MKTSNVSFLLLAVGIIFYAAIYLATSIKKDFLFCEGGSYNYRMDSSIQSSFKKLPGYIDHSITGKNCDTMYVLFFDSLNRNFSSMGDSICTIVKRNGYTLHASVVTKIDTFFFHPKRDTLYSYQCF